MTTETFGRPYVWQCEALVCRHPNRDLPTSDLPRVHADCDVYDDTARHGQGHQGLRARHLDGWRCDRCSEEDELTFDECEALGLDGTLRDGHAPWRWADLNPDQRAALGRVTVTIVRPGTPEWEESERMLEVQRAHGG